MDDTDYGKQLGTLQRVAEAHLGKPSIPVFVVGRRESHAQARPVKRCADCRWNRQYEVLADHCVRYRQQYATGDSAPHTSMYAREMETLCGAEGRGWGPKTAAERRHPLMMRLLFTAGIVAFSVLPGLLCGDMRVAAYFASWFMWLLIPVWAFRI